MIAQALCRCGQKFVFMRSIRSSLRSPARHSLSTVAKQPLEMALVSDPQRRWLHLPGGRRVAFTDEGEGSAGVVVAMVHVSSITVGIVGQSVSTVPDSRSVGARSMVLRVASATFDTWGHN